jgi:hypothetical protein
MHEYDLNKQKALDLISLVVDGEAPPAGRKAFFKYIETDAEVKQQYESQLKIKELVQNRCKKSKAPDYLKSRIFQMIEEENQSYALTNLDIEPETPLTNQENGPVSGNNSNDSNIGWKSTFYRVAVAAAAVIILSILMIGVLEKLSPSIHSTISIEEFALSHFSDTDGQIAFAGFQPASISEAHQLLIEEYDFEIDMPDIAGAEITQVIYTDFVRDYKTPVLEYHHAESSEYIYVFTFKIDSLNQYQHLIRDPEAVEKCRTYDDFHIKEIDNKYVVSWKWGDNWYAAVSNHDGHDLAAIVAPLHNQ